MKKWAIYYTTAESIMERVIVMAESFNAAMAKFKLDMPHGRVIDCEPVGFGR